MWEWKAKRRVINSHIRYTLPSWKTSAVRLGSFAAVRRSSGRSVRSVALDANLLQSSSAFGQLGFVLREQLTQLVQLIELEARERNGANRITVPVNRSRYPVNRVQ